MKNILFSLVLIVCSLGLFANYLGTAIPLDIKDESGPPAVFIEKTANSHRHIILQGSSYHRGLEFGKYTSDVLRMQETLMVSKLDQVIGNSFVQKIFFSTLMLWFHDVDKHIDRDSLEEMQGISKYAPDEFQRLTTNYTRQIAYHGLHEVGQMFVDEDRVDMGCFVSAIQSEQNKWVIGRNFDFDIDGLFDREKIMKWVYPQEGYAYLSVVWPGMVGVVSGINDQGIYASINAAGSDDFSRVGTPTTIVVKKVLSKARTLEEAILIFQSAKTFIAEIFVIADRKTNRVAIIEKSPARMSVKILTKSEVTANHLESEIWAKDTINAKRKTELTSDLRKKRGLELITENTYKDPIAKTVQILRDKSLFDGRQTHLGNRGAIDSMIASQSLIYDMEKNILFVNLGPGTTGKYLGYDLTASFEKKYPVIVKELSADSMTTAEYMSWQDSMMKVIEGKRHLAKNECRQTGEILNLLTKKSFVHYDKSRLAGDYSMKCLNDSVQAKVYWKEALAFYPPYEKQRLYLEEKLK
jgi:predicted choloylglycine hydrolase